MQLILALVFQLQAVGLQEGESFRQLAEAPASAIEREYAYGRVLDAFTGRPLAGATIEAWSEEMGGFSGGFYRFGASRSRRDGQFKIRQKDGSQMAGKSRVSAPGYLTYSGSRGDLYGSIRLFPRMPSNPRIRVLDLQGRPIEGARITSTYTCAHDLPAMDQRTGPDGIASLAEFGLQEDGQTLRLQADGFLAIKYLDGEPMFEQRHVRAPFDVFLPRQRPFRFALLDRAGALAVDTSVHINDGGDHIVGRSDANGLIEISTRYNYGELSLHLLSGPQPRWITGMIPPSSRAPVLRNMADSDPDDWPEGTETGRLLVDLSAMEGASDRGPAMHWFHSDGWMNWMRLEEDRASATVPVGEGFLKLGGPFTGFVEEVHDFQIRAGEDSWIRPRLRRELFIQVQEPQGEGWSLTIQAGPDSRPGAPFDELIPVPPGPELVLVLEGRAGRVQKVIREVIDGMGITFTEELAALPPKAEAKELAEQELRFVSKQTGEAIPGTLSIRYDAERIELDSEKGEARAQFQIRGPIGAPWLASFAAPGHSLVYLRGRLQADEALRSTEVDALARLEIKAPFSFEFPGHDLLDLEALPPGPLDLLLIAEDGRRFGLNLNLEPGAQRLIEIR